MSTANMPPHESPPTLVQQLAADADKKMASPICHARGQEPADHIRELAQAVRLLAQAVRILADKVDDLSSAAK